MWSSLTTADLPMPEYPGDEHQLRPASGDDAIERGEQRLDLSVPPVELLGNHQAIRSVVRAQREVDRCALRLPFGEATAKVALDAGRGLIAILGGLREQLHGDRRELQPGRSLSRSLGGAGCLRDVAVHPFHRIGRRERQTAGQHLVEGDAERVEIAARIDRAVHAPGLLGRHVRERSRDELGRLWALALAREA